MKLIMHNSLQAYNYIYMKNKMVEFKIYLGTQMSYDRTDYIDRSRVCVIFQYIILPP